jgi:nitrate/nitrite transport system substrate-binding protein
MLSKMKGTLSSTRRRFLLGAGAATVGALATTTGSKASSSGYWIAQADTPEVTTAKLGFIALTDAAPLIIAKEKGYFEKYGMKEVEVSKQASWGTTRDNLELGSSGGGIDGAHILTPMPYLMTLGKITKQPVPMVILARLNTNGQGIQLANTYKELKVGLDSSPLKEAFAKAKAGGKELKVAVTFPGGTHDLWMRYWLAAGGIDPTKEVSIIVVPPPQMVANIKVGSMEAFCVGEPWPLQTVNQKVGYQAVTTAQIWQDHPEKSFAMRADWVEKNPKATLALLQAVQEAQVWCDQDANKEEMCEIIAQRKWFGVPVADIVDRSKGIYDFGTGEKKEDPKLIQKYWRDAASYLFKSHDLWFLTEDIRWGYIPATTETSKLVDQVNREDLWKTAAKAIGQESAIPPSSSRGVEKMFDGITFDPANPGSYLDSLKLKALA